VDENLARSTLLEQGRVSHVARTSSCVGGVAVAGLHDNSVTPKSVVPSLPQLSTKQDCCHTESFSQELTE
jgi:hypothetical protein